MKTYLLDILNKYNRFSENLDVRTVLCNKSWLIFNDSGEKELYIFQENGSLFASINGNVTNATWQYISANKSLVISFKEQSYMLHPSFIDNTIFALQQDGTERFLFMISEEQCNSFYPKSLKELNSYFKKLDQKRLQEQEFERLEDERLLVQKAKKEQEERRKIQREKKVQDLQSKANEIKHINGWLQLFIFIISWTAYVGGEVMMIGDNHVCSLVEGVFIVTYVVVGTPCFVFFMPYYTIKLIKNKKAKRWKKNNPDDSVNQYL